jgi:hypothetical protein
MEATKMNAYRLPAFTIFEGRDADQTRRFYSQLEAAGPMGAIALNVFRACKKSTLAKQYKGGNRYGSFKGQSYDQKQWALDQLCKTLLVHAHAKKVIWGWKEDRAVLFGEASSWVLYVDLPFGRDAKQETVRRQVSYHCPKRGVGPDYLGEWDGIVGGSNQVAIEFADLVLKWDDEKAIAKAEREKAAAAKAQREATAAQG